MRRAPPAEHARVRDHERRRVPGQGGMHIAVQVHHVGRKRPLEPEQPRAGHVHVAPAVVHPLQPQLADV